jgi:antitoxin component YwqK of YwqJK toxin-antitoxin module
MKTLRILILALFAGGSFYAQTLNNEGLYVSADGSLFSGRMTKMQHETRVELTVKDGLAEGPAFYYYASGKLMESGAFARGEKNDKWVRYSEKGGVSAIAFYTMGKKSGTWLIYDDAGNKRYEMTYSDGEKDGTWTSWDESGKIVSTKDYSKKY